ncbi:MAG: RDD family protein [Acidothermaceae bacterium]
MTAGVVTGEAVALDVRLAHWPSRLVGFVIDATVQLFLLIFANLALAHLMSGADVDSALAVSLTTLVVIVIGYPVAFETLWRGRSLGKAAMGLRVVRDDGAPERFRHAVARAVLMPLEFWGPALLTSIISQRSKRIGDLLAGTIVVQQRVPGRSGGPAITMPPPLAMWASTLDLSRMSDELALSCRQFLGRQYELHPTARDAMGNQLVAAVQATVTPPPPPGTPGWAYLSAVLAERRRREEWRMRAATQPAFAAPRPNFQQPPQYQPYAQRPAATPMQAPAAPPPAAPAPAARTPGAPAPEPPPGPFAPPQ